MGVVKDGISGFLPRTQVFGVHYPGYPSSMYPMPWRHPSNPQGILCLPTCNSIQILPMLLLVTLTCHLCMQAHSSASNNNRLELRFRHDDPYSHPAFGNSFLPKISKSKSSAAPVQPQSDSLAAKPTPETDQVDLCADIVARVPEAYHFDG
ncbi:hypothetical protein ACLB2K_019531 [Fragaria x ananassa]